MVYKILLFFCLYLPFQLAINPAPGIDLASGRVIAIILFFLWLASSLKNKKIFISFKIQSLLIFSFLFLSFFSLIFSQNQDWSWRKILFLLSFFPLYLITAAAVNDHSERKKRIIQFLLWGGALAAIVGLLQFALQFIIGTNETLILWSRLIVPFLGQTFSQAVLENPSWMVSVSGIDLFRSLAFFPDPHMLAFYLNLLSPFSLVFFLKSKKKIYLIIFILMLLASFLTFSRGGYLGIIASLLTGAVFFTKKISRRKAGWICGSVILALIIIFFFQNPVSRRFYSSFNLNEGSNLGRLATWKESIQVITNNPLGVGLGNYPLEVKPSADYREPIYSHNLYLDIAAETGIINALIFMVLVLYSFFYFYKKAGQDYLNLAGAMGIASFAVHSIFETPLFSVQILPLFLILISLSLNFEKNHAQS